MPTKSKTRILYSAVPVTYLLSASARFLMNLRKVQSITPSRPVYNGIRQKSSLAIGEVSYVHNLDYYGKSHVFVFIHGWGSSTDSAWFNVLNDLHMPYVAIDLPQHGESTRVGDFSLDVSAFAVNEVLDILGVSRAHLVAHSMGGPVSLLALRERPERYSGVSMLASSIYYRTPVMQTTASLAGKVMFKKSPFTVSRVLKAVKISPEHREAIAWAWLTRPSAKTLVSSASMLRNFDARMWPTLQGKDIYFLIPAKDVIVPKKLQKESAEKMSAKTLFLKEGRHNFTITHAPIVLEHLREVAQNFAGIPAV